MAGGGKDAEPLDEEEEVGTLSSCYLVVRSVKGESKQVYVSFSCQLHRPLEYRNSSVF